MNDITAAVEDPALDAFMEYFRRNYPGPDTIIGRPDWHSPKIFRAAVYAIKSSGDLVPRADVQGLVDAVEALNAACDAMWNDHARLEPNPDRFGQKYRLKEAHTRAISEAQQKLPTILTAWDHRK